MRQADADFVASGTSRYYGRSAAPKKDEHSQHQRHTARRANKKTGQKVMDAQFRAAGASARCANRRGRPYEAAGGRPSVPASGVGGSSESYSGRATGPAHSRYFSATARSSKLVR